VEKEYEFASSSLGQLHKVSGSRSWQGEEGRDDGDGGLIEAGDMLHMDVSICGKPNRGV
jgi:hypothetical protein